MGLDREMRALALALIADSVIKMYLTAVCVCVCLHVCVFGDRVRLCVCVLASKYPRCSLRPPQTLSILKDDDDLESQLSNATHTHSSSNATHTHSSMHKETQLHTHAHTHTHTLMGTMWDRLSLTLQPSSHSLFCPRLPR